MNVVIRSMLMVGMVLVLSSCVSAMLGGKSGTRFQCTVQEAYDASLETMNAERLPVLEKGISSNVAHVKSQYPEGTMLGVAIKEVSPRYTQVDVTVQSVGDDYRAYDLMKKIESRLKK